MREEEKMMSPEREDRIKHTHWCGRSILGDRCKVCELLAEVNRLRRSNTFLYSRIIDLKVGFDNISCEAKEYLRLDSLCSNEEETKREES